MIFILGRNSISTRLLVTGLIPLALLSILMGNYFISHQRAEMLGNLHDTGHIAARQVSQNTAFALYSGDRQQLDSLSYATLETPSVTGIVFYSYKGAEKIIIGDSGLSETDVPKNLNSKVPFKRGENWYFFSEILSDRTPVMDYEESVQYEPERIGWVLVSLSEKILREKERSFILTAGTVVIFSLLLTFWLSIRIGRTVSDPLRELTTVVGNMELGDMQGVASEKGITELAQLARGINGLATSVLESNDLMQSEINRATSQLKEALADLEEAMRTKDQFLARMSHELRTPLTAVLGFSNLLFTEDSESKRQEQLRVIERCSTVLLTMIDDILDLSKADHSGFTLNKISFELNDFIEDLAALFLLQAEEKGLLFEIYLEKSTPKSIYGDPVRLAQIISNLVNNAIKFTDSGVVKVHVSVENSDETHNNLKFVVSDTGKGIVEEKIPILFEPFTQEDTSINRRFGGSGLGLSIAKKLVNAMGGNIFIDSAVGRGTTVTFTCQLSVEERGLEPIDKRLLPSKLAKKENLLTGISILIAEDNVFNQQLLEKLFIRHGASCVIATNGVEAIEKVKNYHFDVILMDLHMPIIDGLQAAKTIIEKNKNPPPIIGLTADIVQSEQDKFISAGAIGVQLKPINENKLINTILGALESEEKNHLFSGDGMLASVLPIADLKRAITENIDSLEVCLEANDQASVRPLIHDLMGFCGLYGMIELRDLVLELKDSFAVEDKKKNLQQVQIIRKYTKESAGFK